MLAVSLVTTLAVAEQRADILARAPYRFAPWDSLPRPERSVDRAAWEAAARDTTFRLERLLYPSDSVRVAAYLATPVPAGAPRPCVVYVRGSWRVGDVRAITWTHNLGAGAPFDLELSRDGGTTWEALAAGVPSIGAASGSSLRIPNSPQNLWGGC